MTETPKDPQEKPAKPSRAKKKTEDETPAAAVPAPDSPPRRPPLLAAGAILAAALLGGGVGAATTAALDSDGAATTTVVESAQPAAETTDPTPAASSGDDLSVSEVYREVADGVVEITVRGGGATPNVPTPFGDELPRQGQGSGFVYDEEGHIVTNHHVVDGADSIEVRLADGSTYDAELVGSDASTDLAVLRIDAPAEALEPLALGDSEALEVGEEVVAIGSPFGLDATVTSGIVSAVDRRITAPNGFAIPDAIQTDAAINQGNSGGPLLNMRAEVVGVNSQIETESGGNVGIGFAVPSSTVRSVVADILESGSVEHAFLGVSVRTVPADAAAELGHDPGVAVAEVPSGSPADDAGLRAATGSRTVDGTEYPTGGDVITAFDGEAVETAEELQALVAAQEPGDEVELAVSRDGESRTVTVTLGTRPA